MYSKFSHEGYKQWDNFTCGYQAARTVLDILKKPPDSKTLFADLGTNPTTGTSQTALMRELRRRGVRLGLRTQLTLSEVRTHISNRGPIITYDYFQDHWLLLAGHLGQLVWVLDSDGPNRWVPWTTLCHFTYRFGLLCSAKMS